MLENENQFDQPFGICRRLYNFFMNTLVGHGVKRITLGRAAPQGYSVGIPVNEHLGNGEDKLHHRLLQVHDKGGGRSSTGDSGYGGEEIQIHFKQTEEEEEEEEEELEYWTPIDKLGASVHDEAPDYRALEKRKKSDDQPMPPTASNKELSKVQMIGIANDNRSLTCGKAPSEIEVDSTVARRRGLDERKVVDAKEEAKGEEKKNAKNIAPSERLPVTPAQLFGINEKSESFIQRRKEEMRKHFDAHHN